jgi:hypothetical protein
MMLLGKVLYDGYWANKLKSLSHWIQWERLVDWRWEFIQLQVLERVLQCVAWYILVARCSFR